jgi:GWxTD domain-containing protein
MRHGSFILLGIFLILLFGGCGGQRAVDRYQTGRGVRYLPGTPSFDLETVPSVPGQQSGFDLYLSVPSSSMTFEKVGGQFRSMLEIRASLRKPDDEVTVLLDRTWTDTTTVFTYAGTQRHDPYLIRRHMDVPPGLYGLEVILENLSSQQTEVRRQLVEVPDSADEDPYLGKILVQARGDRGALLPVVPFHIPSGLDSLQCGVTLYNMVADRPSFARVDLVRYQSDTLAASPPMYLTAFDLPLGYSAVGFDRPDTILVRRYPFTPDGNRPVLSMGLRGLSPGNYKAAFEVQTPARGTVPRDTLLRAERFISIGGPTFPRPSTLQELIESMQYIATREEMKLLRGAPTQEIARARFDSLWLTFRRDKKAAADLINRYYTRVEEANQRYTSTKEGWKTDQGMVYIVLGPPVETMNSRDRQVWYYDLRGEDIVNMYTFQRRYVNNGRVSLETYFLYRQPYYEIFWDRQVDKWRTGEVF